MKNGQLKYLALWFFLAGVVLIVLLQFISGRSTDRLLQGNKRLLHEVKIQNDLRKLESGILTIESDVRGAVITNDSSELSGMKEKVDNIRLQLENLKSGLNDSIVQSEIALLHQLVLNKIAFNQLVLGQYKEKGKSAAENLINTGRGRSLRDSILQVTNQLDSTRQAHTKNIINLIESSGNKTRLWNLSLAIIACLACVLAFLYVVNKGRQQQRAINMLNESEKKIREAARVKEQFLANMSHEIRTPMNAILGFTNLLKKTELNSHQLQYVEYIYSSGENLLTLINDILDLSKIEAGMMNIEEAPFSLNGLIASVEIMFHEKALAKGLAFKIDVDPSIHDTLNGDAVRLTQILINLLSNAIKFTDKGSVELSVHPVTVSDTQLELAFVVKDTGVGVAQEKRNSIFDRFQQAEAETTRRYGGTGLGLSIVKQLVDLQKGKLELSSEVGKGSEFKVTLPFTPVQNLAFLPSAAVSEQRPALHGLNVLVAEDNQLNQHLIHHLMTQWNVSFQLVRNGVEALEALTRREFSLVLMDVQMPVMDGYAATAAIRNELKLELPIIAMTAHAMPGEKERCLSFGMNDYISKPLREAELYNLLELYRNTDTAQQENVIQLDYLHQLSMGDAEFEQTIIRQFIIQVPEELDALEKAIETKNLQQIKAVAHGMKSSVSYLGLNDALHPFLQRMELEAIGGGEPNHFSDDLEVIRTICGRALQEAKQLLQTVA